MADESDSGPKSGKFRKLCDTPTAMAKFRADYNIPDNVGLELAPVGADREVATWEMMCIPIVAIVEGGVRFPLDPFLRRVLNWYKLSPMQVSTNFFRLVMGMVALNRILGTQLGLWELQWWYSIVINPTYNTFYFKARKAEKRYVLNLPDSARDHELDFLYVTGAFEPLGEDGQVDGFHCPHVWGHPRMPLSYFVNCCCHCLSILVSNVTLYL
jgi:hypothetical protein